MVKHWAPNTTKHTVNTYFQYRVSRARCTPGHRTKYYVCKGGLVLRP